MSNKVNGDVMYFWKVYRLVGSTNNMAGQSSPIRVCRFCQKGELETTFKTAAHAFPELLGANDFMINDECDVCNSTFSAFESHLSKFFLPYLSVVRIKGKKRVPEFHSRTENNEEKTRTIVRPSNDGKLQVILGTRDDLLIDHENKKMSIRFRLAPHKPLYVYKALVKIGLSILHPELITKYRSVFDWVMGLNNYSDYFPMVYITKILNKKFAAPFAEIYEANLIFKENAFNPELTLIVNFGNLVAQIFMPLSVRFDYNKSDKKSPQLEIYPASGIYNFDKETFRNAKPADLVTIDFNFTCINLTSDKSLIRDEIIDFSFSSFERKKEPKTNTNR